MKQCNACGWVNCDEADKCESCNAILASGYKNVCNRCGLIMDSKIKFCSECGLPVGCKATRVSNRATDTSAKASDEPKQAAVEKVKELIGEENIAKAKVLANEGVIKAKELSEEAAEKAKELVSEENIAKAKNVANEGVVKAKKIGEEAVRQAKTIAVEENIKKAKNVVNEGTAAVKNASENVASNVSAIGKKECAIIAAATILGLAAGFLMNYSSKNFIVENKYDVHAMLSQIKTGVILEGVEKCKVLNNKVKLLSSASSLTGKVVGELNAGQSVEYLGTIDSQDKNKTLAVTSQDLVYKTSGKTMKIPKGTKLKIVKYNGDAILCNFEFGGNGYTENFPRGYVKLGYFGKWIKVKAGVVEGYIKEYEASAPSFE